MAPLSAGCDPVLLHRGFERMNEIDFAHHGSFPRYTDGQPGVPVWCITPQAHGSIHRFFDTSPLSPSGRFAGLTRLPKENRLNNV